MKKILITTGILGPDIGGPATYADIIASDFARDNNVTVVTYSPVLSYKPDKEKKYKIVRVWCKAPKPFRQIDYLFAVLFRIPRYDIVYTLNSLSSGFPTAFVCKLFRKKYVLRISGDRVWEGAVNKGKTSFMIHDFQKIKLGPWLGFLRWLQGWVARGASLNIAHSSYLKSLLMSWGVEADKIEVIHTGINPEPIDKTKEEARKKIAIPGAIILSVGRIVSWKGFKMLIKLMPKLLDINPFFRLVIIGSGPDKKTLESMIANLGLKNKVLLVGKKSPEELKIYFKASEMFVLNTGYEGISHLVLESMGYGIPVITTAIPGNKEVIQQGKNGFLVKYNDEFNLFEAIKTLWTNEELRELFIEEGYKTLEDFTVECMIKETRKILITKDE
ncbi:MAG: glycosyltransferase family 4 protein [Parcubacteria group bacterium]